MTVTDFFLAWFQWVDSTSLAVYACVRFCRQELEKDCALACIFADALSCTCTCTCSLAGAGIFTCAGTCKGWEFDGASLVIWFMINNREVALS